MSGRRFIWYACESTGRMCTWVGPTEVVVVTGLEGVDLGNVTLAFDLPEGAVVHPVTSRAEARRLAAQTGGVVFTVPKADR